MCVSEVEVVAEALYFDGSMYSMVVHGLYIFSMENFRVEKAYQISYTLFSFAIS